MNIEQHIRSVIEQELKPTFLSLENESHMHSGPATQSHFKMSCVSTAFEGLSRVKRHQLVYAALQPAFDAGLHALALHLYTEQEWQNKSVPESPKCMGGSKQG